MKVKYLFLSMLACGLVAACNNDELATEEGTSTSFSGGEAYVKVKIAMSNGASTRATSGGYTNGTEDEQTINSICFAFYDDNGTFVTLGRQQNSVSVTPTTDGDNVEGLAEAVIALELEEGEELPTQVIAFVNVSSTDIDEKNLSVIYAQTITDVGNTTDGFAMTNSSYWSNGEQIATAVASTDFYETEAMATASDNPVVIYVERLAAKVSVTEGSTLEDNIDDLKDSNGNTLSFTLEGYALNGLNKTEYYLKHLQDWSSLTWTWNNADDNRSYWAEDPNYDSMNSTTLKFVSYNDVIANDKEAQYCMENTLTYNLYTSEYYEACTHVLVVGSYTVKDADGNSVTDEDGTFYMYGGIAYSEESIMNILANNGLVFTKTEATEGDTYTSADPDAYELIQIEGTNEATLALKEVEGTTYYTKENGEFVEIEDYEAFNETLAEAVGGAEKYSEGKAYFAVAIEHLGSEGEDGYIGVVRNHSYQLTLQSIKGLGEGVFDPTEEIIPSVSTDTYYVGATLNILSWHVVSQEVNL